MTTLDKVVKVQVDVKRNKLRITHERDLFKDGVMSLGNHPTGNGYVEIHQTSTGQLYYSHRPWSGDGHVANSVYENYPISVRKFKKLLADAFHVKGHESLWFNLWNRGKSK